MKVLSTLTKTTEGRQSSWHFCEAEGKFFALRVLPTLKTVSCKDRSDLVGLYNRYLTPKYGFRKPVVTPDPWS